MTDTTDLLTRNLHGVFGERDPARRRAAIEALYAPTARFVDHAGTSHGWDGIDQAAAAVQARAPGFVFSEIAAPQTVGEAGRVHWGFGPAGATPVVSGTDVALVEDGRIVALYVFLDG